MKQTNQIQLPKPVHSGHHNPADSATRIRVSDKLHGKISNVLNRLSIHLSTLVLLGVAVIAWLAPMPATAQTNTVNICDRTPQVEAAILAAINPTPGCRAVPEADLALITSLHLSEAGIIYLASGDFTGLLALVELDLSRNRPLTTLPDGVFDSLSALERLDLGFNDFTTLPAGVFDGLSALEDLNLSSNDFTTVPAGVDSLSALERLDLGYNDFTTLPAAVFDGLPALEDLNLRGNAFTTLPAGVFDGLSALERLDLGYNDFTTLPAAVFDGLPALEDLNLSFNDFTTVPAGVFDGLSALERLDLGYNDFTTLPAAVFDGLPALEDLNLSFNDFTTVPAGVFDGLSALEALSLSNNYLITLPAGVFDGLPALEDLNLSGNALTTLPAGVFDGLSALERLNLSDNALTTLPAGVFDGLSALVELGLPGNLVTLSAGAFDGLSALERLNLSGNALTTLPAGVFDGLSALERLNLSDNALTTLPAGVFDGLSALVELDLIGNRVTLSAGVFDGLSALEDLNLSGNGLTTLPAGVFDGLSALVELDLVSNGLTTLSAGVFDGLPALEALSLYNNSLTTLPAGVFDGLSSLETLWLYRNDLTTLPAGVFDGLSALVTLELDINRLITLPAGVFDGLSALETLRLNNNALTTLPAGVFDGLSALVELDLDGNNLTTLPAGVFDGLSALVELDLSSYDLTTLSAGVFDGLSALENLWLYNNALTTLPAGVFDGLPALENLWLYNNALTTLPAGVFDGLSALEALSLHNNALTTLPAGVFDGLPALENLWLYNNALTTLPAGVFDGLSALEALSLNRNALTRLPAGVFDGLPALENLWLYNNALTTLPAGVFDGLPALENLWLYNNALTTLPAGVFDGLSALEALSLSNNYLITLPAGVFDNLSVLDWLNLRNNNFRSSIGLPAGVLDDVLDTLGLINPDYSFPGPFASGFFVDDIVRRAHFVCSRADADAIVAATAGVDDCLRITSAQLNIALQNAVTANGQLTDAIDALDIPGDGIISPDLLQRINNVLADADVFADIVTAALADGNITVSQAIDFLATLNASLELAGTAIQAGAAVEMATEMATVTGIIDGIGDVIAALDDTSLTPTLIDTVQGAAQTTLAAVSDLVADDADPDSTEAIMDSTSYVVNAVLGVDATLEGDFKAATQSLAESVLQKSLDDIAVALGRDRAAFTFTDTESTRALLAENPTLLDKVLEVTAISLTGTTQLDAAVTRSAITDAGISAEGAEALTADLNQFVIPPAFMLEIDGQVVSVLDLLNNAMLGFGAATVDSATGTVVFAADIGAIEAFVTDVAIVPDSVPEGVFMIPDGSVLSIADGVAITLAPSPVAPIEFAAAIDVIGGGEFTTAILANGVLVLSHTPTGIAFNATFAFDVSSGEPVAVTSFTAPEGNDPADPEHLFGVTFEEGSTQSIVPMIAAPQFYDSMAAMGFEMETDRSTGVITINGSRFRADYFSWPATSSEIQFLDSNADASGVAYIPTDANGDGIMDSKVITRINDVATMQFLYRLP